MDSHTHDGSVLRATRAGQCHRPWPYPDESASRSCRLSAAGRRAAFEAWARTQRVRANDPLSVASPLGHRPDDCTGRRAASRLEDPRRLWGRGMTPRRPAADMPDVDVPDELDDTVEDSLPPAGSPELEVPEINWDSEQGDTEGKIGIEVIQTLVKRLPNAPGVYRMINKAGDVLYVGKARSLKKRVSNYAQ